DQKNPTAITSDGERVYWASYDSQEIWSVSVDGADPKNLATGQQHPGDVAVDAQDVYWTTLAGVMKAPKQGGPARPLVDSEPLQAYFLAVDEGSVYWTAISDGFVFSAPKAGAAEPRRLAMGQRTPWGVAVDGASVYWVDKRDHAVLRSSKDGREQAVMISRDLAGPETIAVDATHLYIADGAAGTILALSKDGRERTVLASGIGTPSAVAVDEGSVYFTAFGDGEVWKIDK